jgi:hypothetical protein
MRRSLALLLTILLAAGVGTAIYYSVSEQAVQQVKGLVGSEKDAFFRDPRVIEALRRNSLQVDVVKAGSRDIATKFNLKEYDFAFPAGIPAAEKIKRDNNIAKFYPIFFTPITVGSWKRVAEVLEANGIVRKRNDSYYIVDMPRLLALVKERKRWNELPRSESFPVGKGILISSTDVRRSNSGAMYLSLASYIYNNNSVVSNERQIYPIIDDLTALFARQGFTEYSSEAPFQDYLAQGPGKSPLVLIYEAQFLQAKAEANSPVSQDMVLLYPEPTVFTKHILVPVTAKGERLGEALMNDPGLKALAIEHGFRNDDRALFNAFVKKNNLTVPDEILDVADVPSYEIIERMITLIEEKYRGGSNVPTGQ